MPYWAEKGSSEANLDTEVEYYTNGSAMKTVIFLKADLCGTLEILIFYFDEAHDMKDECRSHSRLVIK